MRRLTWTAALAGAALSALVAASAAQAQNAVPAAPAAAAPAAAPVEAASAPKKAKVKKAAANSASTVPVSVWNSRSTDLTELQVAETGSASFKKVLGKLKAGKKTGVQVPKGKDCQIDLHATFADGETTEASAVDVCTQKVLNLTD
jgi:hypothetical protein